MRRQHWLAAVGWFLVLLSCGRPASAQPPYGDSDPQALTGTVYPGGSAPAPSPYGAPGAHAPPLAPDAAFAPPGVYTYGRGPAGATPVPEYTAVLPPGADAGAAGLPDLDAAVAAPPSSVYPWPKISPFDYRFSQHYRDKGMWHWDANNRPRQYYAGAAAWFPRFRKPEESLFGHKAFLNLFVPGTGTDPNQPPPSGFLDPVIVGTSTANYGGAHIFDRDLKTEAIRGHWGFINPDDSGLEITAWWASDVTENFKRGQQQDLTDPTLTIFPPAIPVQTGIDPVPTGELLRFNRLFELSYSEEAFNAGIDYHYTPLVNFQWLKIKPLVGFRYTFVKEKMNFHGFDEGPPAFASFLNTKIQSHLYGPEFGLRGEMGGQALRVVGGVKAILYVNTENLEMDGDNFGTAAQVNQFRFFASETFFRQEEHSTHLSPGIEGTVHFEANVFPYIPVLKKWHPLEKARLRGGFTYLVIGEVARPNTSVIHRGLPLVPELKTDRSAWHIVGWDVGLEWRF